MSNTPTPIPRDTFDPTEFQEQEKKRMEEAEMSFVDHIDVLRKHVIRAILAILVFAILAFIFKGFVVDTVLLGPTSNDFWTYKQLCKISSTLCFDLPDAKTLLYSRKLSGQFTLHITISIIVGVVVAFPYVFYEIWKFISPALYNKEQTSISFTVFFVSVLFSIGILFGYYIISPLTYTFFVEYSVSESITNEFDISSYFAIVGNLVLISGLMFQLPVVCYFAAKAGLLYASDMVAKRRIAIVAILFIAAVFTPPDIFSQLLIATPLLLLYELSIVIVKRINREE